MEMAQSWLRGAKQLMKLKNNLTCSILILCLYKGLVETLSFILSLHTG